MIGRYGDAQALRRALEDRLRQQSSIQGWRWTVCARRRHSPDSWPASSRSPRRLGAQGWYLADLADRCVHACHQGVDTNWRKDAGGLEEDFLAAVEERDLDDGFAFTIGHGRALQGEGDDRARRFAVRCLLAGRDFERFHLDVNLVPSDPRPVENVQVARDPFAFADIEPPTVPMLPVAQQLAEKLHACVREYADGASSRSKDAFDTVFIAASVPLPDAATLTEAVRATFSFRRTPIPPAPPPMPPAWRDGVAGFLADYPLGEMAPDADKLAERFNSFWSPLLAGKAVGRWVPERWAWAP